MISERNPFLYGRLTCSESDLVSRLVILRPSRI
jgi:hypothetical protein